MIVLYFLGYFDRNKQNSYAALNYFYQVFISRFFFNKRWAIAIEVWWHHPKQ